MFANVELISDSINCSIGSYMSYLNYWLQVSAETPWVVDISRYSFIVSLHRSWAASSSAQPTYLAGDYSRKAYSMSPSLWLTGGASRPDLA